MVTAGKAPAVTPQNGGLGQGPGGLAGAWHPPLGAGS